MNTITKLKFGWKYRKLLWKYRKALRHRKTILGVAVAGAAIGTAVLLRASASKA
jgi:hypothetical protein